MLFTRCPGCQTTFRITPEALQKAGGQVRCGRCATVFDAYAALRDETGRAVAPGDPAATPSHPEAEPARATPQASPAPASPPGAPASAASAPGTRAGAPAAASAERGDDGGSAAAAKAAASEPVAAPSIAGGREALDPAYGETSVAEVMQQIERGGAGDGATDDPEDGSVDAPPAAAGISPAELSAVLLEGDEHVHSSTSPWLPEEPRASKWWTVAAVLALLALAVQAVHHFRNELALHEIVGAPLRNVYAMLGAPLSPRWDLSQYQILDWVAAAEPGAGGRGSLKITARIRNRGPRAQPYPQIHLQLEDRWETSVGSRVFTPDEYLTRAPETMMEAGATAQAELEVLDPGPDAYGFELDVCIDIEGSLRCSADLPFR